MSAPGPRAAPVFVVGRPVLFLRRRRSRRSPASPLIFAGIALGVLRDRLAGVPRRRRGLRRPLPAWARSSELRLGRPPTPVAPTTIPITTTSAEDAEDRRRDRGRSAPSSSPSGRM